MIQKSKRILALVLCLCMAVSLLAGCGSKQGPDSSSQAASSAPASQPDSEPESQVEPQVETIEQAGTVSGLTLEQLIIGDKVKDGTVILEDSTITDTLFVYGGARIELKNCVINKIVVLNKDVQVRLVATGATNVEEVVLNTPAILEEKDIQEGFYGFKDLTSGSEASAYAFLKLELVNTQLDKMTLNKQVNLTKTGTSQVGQIVNPDMLVDDQTTSGSATAPRVPSAKVPGASKKPAPAPAPAPAPVQPDSQTPSGGSSDHKPTPPPAQKTPVELAQQSFNTLPVFVDRNGVQITQGELNIAETSDTDFPYLSQRKDRTKNQEGLDKYGYVEKEYFLQGNANIYGLNEAKDGITVESQGNPYTNRVIVYMPEDPAQFQGVVYVDILNASGWVDVPDLWRRGYEHFMKNGYAYVGITSKPCNVDALKRFDSDRYAQINWSTAAAPEGETGFAWDIFGQVGAMLKENGGASRLLYGADSTAKVERSYLIGQSQSGFYVNTFNNGFGQANYIAGTQQPIFDGMLNVVGVFSNAALSNQAGPIEGLKESAVPFITLVGQNDHMGQAQRADSNTATDKYRYYVVTGGAHSNKIFAPDPLDEIQMKAGRDAGYLLGFKPDPKTGLTHTSSNLDMDVYFNAVLERLDRWAAEGIAPPSVAVPDKSKLDEYGNMLGGIRSPQIDVPVAAYTGSANGEWFSTDGSSMVYLSDEQIAKRYPEGKAQYLREYQAAVDQTIADGWVLEEDRQRLMAQGLREAEVVFDDRTYDTDFINEVMSADVKVVKDGSDVTVSGPANLYGVLKDDVIYVKKGNLPAGQLTHSTHVTLEIPQSFDGTVVIDLQNPQQPHAVSAIGQNSAVITLVRQEQDWQMPCFAFNPKKPEDGALKRKTDGFVWDVISQIANSVKTNPQAWGLEQAATSVKLAGDADQILTYLGVFGRFDACQVDGTDVELGSASPIVLGNLFLQKNGKAWELESKLSDTTKPAVKAVDEPGDKVVPVVDESLLPAQPEAEPEVPAEPEETAEPEVPAEPEDEAEPEVPAESEEAAEPEVPAESEENAEV